MATRPRGTTKRSTTPRAQSADAKANGVGEGSRRGLRHPTQAQRALKREEFDRELASLPLELVKL